MSRPALPRDENGKIVRPDGSIGPKPHAPKTAAVLAFDGQKLTADTGAEYVAGVWKFDNYTAADAESELEAAQKAVEVLTAIRAALKGLPVLDKENPYAALKNQTEVNRNTLLRYFVSGK